MKKMLSSNMLLPAKAIRYATYRMVVVLLCALSAMSFRYDTHSKNGGDKAQVTSDTTKGFKNLLGEKLNETAIFQHFELNPKVIPFVQDYISKQGSYMEKMKSWGAPYFIIFDQILLANGLPAELKYLSVIESNLQSGVISSAGAVGPWQLMPNEAKHFGLIVTSRYDERTNYLKSTVAASKLLKQLYNEFGDWLLVIAAYNAGMGGVKRAIKKAGSKNFWDLQAYLPAETQKHVKKYIAAHYYFEGSGGWTTLTASECTEKKVAIANMQNKPNSSSLANTATMAITGKYNSVVMTNILLMDIAEFNNLNPLFDKLLSEGNSYIVTLPNEKLEVFKNKRQQILYESVQLLLSASSQQVVTTNN
ncbi:MAG: lytic transglycosylase domain-containing protein [Panacibacter sp.]